MMYSNPILPGFYPDPSIIRVEEDYYMVTSSFEYYPGVPIFHSRNLVQWEQIGHVLTRKNQVDLRSRKSSEGIFAPTLRYHDGVFYMITTDVWGIGNFYVTATSPEGPWSDPTLIPFGGIDPSLFFDDDGKVYVTVQKGADYHSHAIQYEIDIKTGEALSEPVVIWRGDGGPWTEGPHLYKINGLYYIMTASGGTGREHREIIGRSHHSYGPFERLPYPILTHNRLPDHPIQFTGHADLVDDQHGNWWMVFLGVRHIGKQYSVLGRETFLAPVVWNEDGWPMVDNNDGIVNLSMPAAQLPAPFDGRNRMDEPFHDDFDGESLDHRWCFLRYLSESYYSLSEREGCVALKGQASDLNMVDSVTFLGMRQQHFDIRVTTMMTFAPQRDGEEAGLSIRLRESAHYELTVKQMHGQRWLMLSTTSDRRTVVVNRVEYSGDEIWLRINGTQEMYQFLYSQDGHDWSVVGEAPTSAIAPEIAGGFTGVCLGMYASGNGQDSEAAAHFDWFEYVPG